MSSTKSSLRLRRESDGLLDRLNLQKGLLRAKRYELKGLPGLTKTRENAVKQQQDLLDKQTRAEADRDRLKRNRKEKLLRHSKERKYDLPKEIAETEKSIKALEAQYSKAKAHEAQLDANRAAAASNVTQSNAGRPAGEAPTGQKRKGMVSEEERPLKRQRSGTMPPPAAVKKPRFTASYVSTMSREAIRAMAPDPSTRFQLTDMKARKAALNRNEKKAAVTSTKPAPPKPAVTRVAKRKAVVEDDEDEQPPTKKQIRASLKRKNEDAEASSSNPAAPSCSSSAKTAGSSKRPAPDDEESEASNKRQKTNPEESKAGEAGKSSNKSKPSNSGKEGPHGPRGFINHRNSCFSAAVLQVFDAAFEGHDLDQLLGKKTELKNFGLTRGLSETFDKENDNDLLEGKKTTRGKGQKRFRKAIKEGTGKDISTALHLRNLLGEFRKESRAEDNSKDYVSPLLFQSVFAYGSGDNVDKSMSSVNSRQDMNGDTQQDAFEYYQGVLNSLGVDEYAPEEGKAVKRLFEINTETTDKCPNEGCDYQSDGRDKQSNNYHNVIVPAAKKIEFSRIFEESTVSTTETVCPKCSAACLESHTTFVDPPENLVITTARGRFESETVGGSKLKTEVELDSHKLTLSNGAEYDLTAVVCHQGESLDLGHYTTFRKHGDKWFLIDDKRRMVRKADEVGDCRKAGQSSMLLWRKARD